MLLPGRGAPAGEHRDRAAVISAIEALVARTSDSSAEVVLDRLVSGNFVAIVLRDIVARHDEGLELHRVKVCRGEAGKFAEIYVCEASHYEVDALLG